MTASAALPTTSRTVRHELIYHDAGATTPELLTVEQIQRLIVEAGREPVERDTCTGRLSGIGRILRPGRWESRFWRRFSHQQNSGALDPHSQCAILEEVKKKVRDQFVLGGGF